MVDTPAISDAEAVVLDVIWRTNPITTEDIIAELSHRQDWQEPTIKTLINRLLKKRAISAVKEGRRYLYSPELARDEWLSNESKKLVDRLFGGRITPLVAHFSQERKLTKKDLEQLKALIEQLNDER
jgi:predicted transcriptional regulator